MTKLPDFKLGAYLSSWEFRARYNLSASDAQSLTLAEILALAEPADRETFEAMSLGYTETYGAPDLRSKIASTYDTLKAENILCFAGAAEGIFAAMHLLLGPLDHAIVVTPNYQAAESVPLSLCSVTGVPLDPDRDWTLDIDRVASEIKPNTKLISINFPHNPTGKILEADRFDALISLCRRHGIWLFSDEIFRPLDSGRGTIHLQQVADAYERGISLAGMSKAYGLPGLRIGWIAARDRKLLDEMERYKSYLSICNACLSERVACIALSVKERILTLNRAITGANLQRLDLFFKSHQQLFDWYQPDGGCVAYPGYRGVEGVERWSTNVLEQSGVLVLPASLFASDLGETPRHRFRIGFGRRSMDEALIALERFLTPASDRAN